MTDQVAGNDELGGGAVRREDVEARVAELLSQLTLEEKLSMMDGDLPFWRGMAEVTEGDHYHRAPFTAGAIPRLGIEGIRFVDGPRGIVLEGGATTFPVSMARGASWDPELEERIGDAIGKELRSHGGNLFGGVCVNLLRHPAWGRAQETYGEDPVHLGAMGAALLRGVQRHAIACVKHFALNSIENARFQVDVIASKRVLHEMYLPQFKACVDAGAAAVMSAYNAVNGEWCGQNHALLTGILKGRWGFEGFVLTDFVFGLRDAKVAALAGQDLEMPFHMVYHPALQRLVRRGEVPVARIDDAVTRLLRQQLRFVSRGNYPATVRACAAHVALARESARKSVVLLKNEDQILPLSRGTRLAVIGRLADTPNLGDRGSSDTRPPYVVTPLQGLREVAGEDVTYTPGEDLAEAQRVASEADAALVVVGYTHREEGEYVIPPDITPFAHLVPPPRALRWLFSLGPMRRIWTRIVRAMARRQLSSTVGDEVGTAFGVGGDRASLGLPADQVALIRAVAAANPRTIVAVMAGSAVIVEDWRDEAEAILMLWYPGMEGGHALADLLYGDVNPSGKLPFVVPRRAADLPFFDRSAQQIEYDLWHGYRKLEQEGIVPAYPFGYGLSYTRYGYADLALEAGRLGPEDTLRVRIEVANEGAYAGEEVVQLYVGAIGSAVARAPKELKAFTRVVLAPGERKPVHLKVPVQALAYYDEGQGAFVVEPVEYEVFVGRHSLDEEGLRARFVVEEAKT
jgi:beta-glucosidase